MSNHGGQAAISGSQAYSTEVRVPPAQHVGDSRRRRATSRSEVASASNDHLEKGTVARQRTGATFGTRTGGRKVLDRALVLPILVAVALVGALLIWWAIDSLGGDSTAKDSSGLDVAALLSAGSAATAVPVPTKTQEQIAAQFEPQLQDALSGRNWDRALEIVAIMSSVNPDGAKVRGWAFTTTMQYGQHLVDSGYMDQALDRFDQAAALAPEDAEARLWLKTTQLYLAGLKASEAGQLEAAIRSFSLAREQLPNYGDLSGRLVEAYLGHAEEEMTAGSWTAAIETLNHGLEQLPDDPSLVNLLASAYRQRGTARHQTGMTSGIRINIDMLRQAEADLDAALALRPDDAEARAVREKVIDYLYPANLIEVDISEQRVYAWQDDVLVYEFPVSTGLPGQDTATGNFQVLDKIPMAHSNIWQLNMPNWLGIYYVQGIENGFHALPFRPDGTQMWAGLLGQKASYGCIVLGTEAGRALYDWAEIGTRVDIRN